MNLLSSIFMLVFSSIKFDIGFIYKHFLLTILESMPIIIFSNSKNSNFPCSRTLCIVCSSYFYSLDSLGGAGGSTSWKTPIERSIISTRSFQLEDSNTTSIFAQLT
jgi:hypothetical protein